MKKIIGGLSVFVEGNHKNKAIIFLHGFPYDHTIWQAQVDAFSEQFCCVAYDIKGLGGSSVGDGQFTMESFVDDLEVIIKELGLEMPIVCGHSMAGISFCVRWSAWRKSSQLLSCVTQVLKQMIMKKN